MRGSVGFEKKSRRWFYRHDLRPGPSGERRQKRIRGFARKTDAERALAESIWAEWQKGPAPAGVTVQTYLELQLAERKPRLAAQTIVKTENTFRYWVEPTRFGKTSLALLTRQHIEAWFRELGGRGLAPTTIGSAWRVVLALLRPLIVVGSLPADLLQAAAPRIPRPPLRVWNPEQLRLVLSRLDAEIYAQIAVLATTGLRAGELLALRWEDWQGDGLVVEKSLEWPGAAGPSIKSTKNERFRRVALYPETIEILKEHRDRQRKRKLILPGWDTKGLIFPRWSGGYQRPQTLSTMFQNRLKRIEEVPKIRLHDLRHTHASHLLAAGVDIASVAMRLGDTIQTVLKTYSHYITGGQAEAVRLGSEFLGLRRGAGEVKRPRLPCAGKTTA